MEKRQNRPASGQVGPESGKEIMPPGNGQAARPSFRLRFGDEEAQGDWAASGQLGPESRRANGGKFKQDMERPRPSKRLRQDGEPDTPPGPNENTDGNSGPGTEKCPDNENGGHRDNGHGQKERSRSKQQSQTGNAQAKADKAGKRLEQTKEKLAAQKPPKPSGLGKKAVKAAGTSAWIYVHNKIHQVEHENVGVESAHKAELVAEAGARRVTRFTKRRIREHPARVVEKWEQKSLRANANLHFQKMAQEHPELHGKSFSRFLQKRKIKRDYQKKARKAVKTTQNTASVMGKLGRAVGAVIKRHPLFVLLLLLIAAAFLIISSTFSTIPILGNGLMNAMVGTSYTSEDTDLVAVEQAYVSKENQLQSRLDHIKQDYPLYDEYRYDLDSIQHNPHELASYLTALYQTYILPQVQEELQQVFDRQYALTLTETVEVRYRTETHTSTDPETGETTTDSEEVPYDYYILNVELVNRQISTFVAELLNGEQLQMFRVYLETSGNKPLVFGGGSPDTTPSESLGGVQFVNGTRPGNPAVVEIGKSQVRNVGGQPYWNWYGFNSRVAWCACFVSWCYDQAGASGPRFAACQSQGIPWFQSHGQWGGRNYRDIAPGDAIFFDWDGDGSADHVGLVIGTDGERVYTVEGNSGNACKIKSYPLDYGCIKGYGLMNWN